MSHKRSASAGDHPSMLKRCSSLTEEHHSEVDNLFSKRFCYSQVTKAYYLDGGEAGDANFDKETKATTVEDYLGDHLMFTDTLNQNEHLMAMKEELNELKDKLSGMDIETWHKHTTDCNLAAKIQPYIKNMDVELCTQAWCKFYETLSFHNIVPEKDFTSVHLCEAPGAFVTALNHFMHQHGLGVHWNWHATTLNPYYEANSLAEMVSDDRLIRLTHQHWYFGSDGSGDITAPGHLGGLCKRVEQSNPEGKLPVLLVTADGSRDCQENPAEQEAMLHRLHFCEMIAACLLLEFGGCFVFKVFTMFEWSSVTLMFLLNIMFEEVNMTKPATSKSGNSETYLVCRGYRKNVSQQTLWEIANAVVYGQQHLQVPKIPMAFLQEHQVCCAKFSNWQRTTISRNMQLFETMTPQQKNLLVLQQELARDKFVDITGLCHLKYMDRVGVSFKEKSVFLVSQSLMSSQQPLAWQHKRLSGTFNRRQNLSAMSPEERVRMIESREMTQPLSRLQCNQPFRDGHVAEWSPLQYGSPLKHIYNSRLCHVGLMEDYVRLVTYIKVQNFHQDQHSEHAKNLGEKFQSILTEFISSQKLGHTEIFLGPTPKYNFHSLSKSEIDKLQDKMGHSDQVEGPDTNKSQSKKVKVLFYTDVNSDSENYQTFVKTVQETACADVTQVTSSRTDMLTNCLCDDIVLCDASGFLCASDEKRESAFTELDVNKVFLAKVLPILKTIPVGASLVIVTTTFLTRLSSTLLYILARLFHKTSLHCHPGLLLHQLLHLSSFYGLPTDLDTHLSKVLYEQKYAGREETSSQCLMELCCFHNMLKDRKFVQFVTENNNFAVTGFVNILLKQIKTSASV